MRKSLLLLLFAGVALGQPAIVTNPGIGVPILTAAPGTCTPNVAPSFIVVSANGSTGAPYFCSAPNTWSAVGSTTVNITTACGVTGGPITGTGGLSGAVTLNNQTGATPYALANADCGKMIYRNNAAAVSDTLAQAGGGGNFAANWYTFYTCVGAGGCTITPTISQINGASSLVMPSGTMVLINSDGANYRTAGDVRTTVPLAVNLAGTPALPNGTTATTQTGSDNTTALATDAFVQTAVTNMVTAGANYTNGDLVQAAGANKTTSDSGIATANVVTAAAAYTSGDLVQAAGANKTTSDSGIATANVVTAASPFSANALVKGGGANKTTAVGDVQDNGNALTSTTATQQVTYQGGIDSATNTALGGVAVRGADQTATTGGGASSAAGSVSIRGGNNTEQNTASSAGGIEILAGASTGTANAGQQGLLTIGLQFVRGASVTQYNLVCLSGTKTITNCAASPTAVVGVAHAVGAITVEVHTMGETPINGSAAVTVGDTVCAGSSAGVVTDSGGTSACTPAQGITIGVVEAIAGTYRFGDGSSQALSNVLPLVALVTLDMPAGVVEDPGSNGIVSRTGLHTSQARTITAGSTQISVTNGDGTGGNPTIDIGTLTANTSGTAGGLSTASALPNLTTATTQTTGDSSADVATDAFVANGLALKLPVNNPTYTGNMTTPFTGGGTRCAHIDNSGVLGVATSDCGVGTGSGVTLQSVSPTFGGTTNITLGASTIFNLGTLTGNTTIAVSGPTGGVGDFFMGCEDGVGGRIVTWPASFKNIPAFDPAANACSFIGPIGYDGTSSYYNPGSTTAGLVALGTTASDCGTVASGTLCVWLDSTSGTMLVKDSAGNIYKSVKCANAATGTCASTDLSDTANLARITTSNAYSSGTTQNSGAAAHTVPTIVVASVGALPSTGCINGELGVVTAATLGQQLYENSGTGTCVWTQQLNSGQSGGSSMGAYGYWMPFGRCDYCIGGSAQAANSGYQEQFVPPFAITLGAVTFEEFSGGAASTGIVCIYSDNNGVAGTLLGSSATFSTATGGVVKATFGTPVSLSAGTPYWLTISSDVLGISLGVSGSSADGIVYTGATKPRTDVGGLYTTGSGGGLACKATAVMGGSATSFINAAFFQNY